MRGNYDVNIFYWKVWRSREFVLDYVKGICGVSYNFFFVYFEKLIYLNSGIIIVMYIEYVEGIGYKFKYLFFVLFVCVEGYKLMRKVVIVDGTYLRGKYVGCLLIVLV